MRVVKFEVGLELEYIIVVPVDVLDIFYVVHMSRTYLNYFFFVCISQTLWVNERVPQDQASRKSNSRGLGKRTDNVFDFRYENGKFNLCDQLGLSNYVLLIYRTGLSADRHEACRSNGSWQAVNFDKFCFECPQGSEKPLVFGEGDIMNTQFFHLAENWEVDFPSIVFVIKPTDDKPLYDRIKVMSNYFGGIPSQCVVLAKYKSQRGTQADQ